MTETLNLTKVRAKSLFDAVDKPHLPKDKRRREIRWGVCWTAHIHKVDFLYIGPQRIDERGNIAIMAFSKKDILKDKTGAGLQYPQGFQNQRVFVWLAAYLVKLLTAASKVASA